MEERFEHGSVVWIEIRGFLTNVQAAVFLQNRSFFGELSNTNTACCRAEICISNRMEECGIADIIA